MMDPKLHTKYCKRFACDISFSVPACTLTLTTADKKMFDLDDLDDEELDALMQESLDKDENILLEKFRDKEYTFIPDPDCDY